MESSSFGSSPSNHQRTLFPVSKSCWFTSLVTLETKRAADGVNGGCFRIPYLYQVAAHRQATAPSRQPPVHSTSETWSRKFYTSCIRISQTSIALIQCLKQIISRYSLSSPIVNKFTKSTQSPFDRDEAQWAKFVIWDSSITHALELT